MPEIVVERCPIYKPGRTNARRVRNSLARREMRRYGEFGSFRFGRRDCIDIARACFRRHVDSTTKLIFIHSPNIGVNNNTSEDIFKRLLPRWTASALSNFQLFIEKTLTFLVTVAGRLAAHRKRKTITDKDLELIFVVLSASNQGYDRLLHASSETRSNYRIF